MQIKLRAALNKTFTITYTPNTGRLTSNVIEHNFTYSILTDNELKSFIGWTGHYHNPNNLKSCNGILNNDQEKVCTNTYLYICVFFLLLMFALLWEGRLPGAAPSLPPP